MPPKKRIGEILLDEGLITQEQLDMVLNLQKKNPQRKFGEILVTEGLIDRKTLTDYLLSHID